MVFYAINGFRLVKTAENQVTVYFPSDSSYNEFSKVSADFFNHFRHKANHFTIEVRYEKDEINLKKQVMTKRKMFEKFAEINPLVRELDTVLKFDLN